MDLTDRLCKEVLVAYLAVVVAKEAASSIALLGPSAPGYLRHVFAGEDALPEAPKISGSLR